MREPDVSGSPNVHTVMAVISVEALQWISWCDSA
jgi:hypothetical protein